MSDDLRGFKYAPLTGNLYRLNKRTKKLSIVKTKNIYGYIVVLSNGKQYKAHRLIYMLMTGKNIPKHLNIDHINGIKDDNRWNNLRIATTRENAQNSKNHRNGKLVGASFHKNDNKFHSRIYYKGKNYFLGVFNTEIEAHNAYKKSLEDIKNERFL